MGGPYKAPPPSFAGLPMNIELFSCSGGMAEGFRRAGIEIDMAFDFNADACSSYEQNLGHRPIQMCVRDLLRMVKSGWRHGQIKLLVADPPCTPWSRAGKRQGLDDERDMVCVTVEIIEFLRPRTWLIGNVPGLDDGDNWREVVQPIIGGMARRAGYAVDYAKLNAADYGTPQHRRRPFWFGRPATSSPIDWPPPTHRAPPVLPGCGLHPWVTCRDALAHLSSENVGRPCQLRSRAARQRHSPSRIDEPGHAVTCSQSGNGGSVLVGNRKPDANRPPAPLDSPHRTITSVADQAILEWPWDRPCTTIQGDERLNRPGHHDPEVSNDQHLHGIILSEKAGAALQGFPSSWVFSGSSKRTRWSQIGQAMPPQLSEAVGRSIARWMERDK